MEWNTHLKNIGNSGQKVAFLRQQEREIEPGGNGREKKMNKIPPTGKWGWS